MFRRLRNVSASTLVAIATTTCITTLSTSSTYTAQCEEQRLDASGRPRSVMYIRDPDAFARKWKQFSTAGLDQLLVIADFDYTLTPRFRPDGVTHGDSSHGILMKSNVLDPALHQLGHQLFERYWPIEQSTTLTNEEKLPFLIEWWNTEHELLIQYKLTRELLVQAVQTNDLSFREGCMELLKLLSDAQVPTLIFSAGLYDVIHAVLEKAYAKATPPTIVPSNLHVVSNMMEFNNNGLLVGFQGKLIHSQNKNASVVTDTPFWRQCQLEKRHYILLLGDSIHDIHMSNGLNIEEEQILRIGLLNERVEEQLNLYLSKYDIVLTHDSSLLPIELLLQTCTSFSSSTTYNEVGTTKIDWINSKFHK